MAEIGRTLLFSFQMTSIDSKVREVIPIPGILAGLEISLDQFSVIQLLLRFGSCREYIEILLITS